jgi:RsiW-degrading membrane proteinase PrsW (M82 family)
MLFDNGIFWLVIIVLTVTAAVLFGVYNRQDGTESDPKQKVLLILGWVILGIDLAIFAYAVFQALELKKGARRIITDTKAQTF